MSFFKKHFIFILIFSSVIFLFLFRLDRDLLTDWDECVIAEQAKEMKLSGNYITSQFNNLLLFEKPPVNNWWMQVGLFFGNTSFNYRIIMVIFSLLTLVLMYYFCLEFFSLEVGLFSVLLILTTPLFIDFSTKVNTDIGFTFFTFLGFLLWILSYKKNIFSYFAGVSFGLAVMTKGLSITPYIGTIAIFTLINSVCHSEFIFRLRSRQVLGSFKKMLKQILQDQGIKNLIKMLLFFLIIILPWHLYEYLKYGNNFIQVYFIEHLFRRASTTLDFHFEGRLFYFKLLFNEFKYWLLILLVLPFYLVKEKNKLFKNQLFLILSLIILTLLSITLVKTRISWYALPLYPFISIALSFLIFYFFSRFKIQWLKILIYIIVVINAFLVINNKVKIQQDKTNIAVRDDVFLKINNLKEVKEVNYLVWESERIAEAILPVTMRTSTTFYFGGNPCAVFFSNKKINYFYNIDKFVEKLKKEKGYFVIYVDDLKYLNHLKYKILYKNDKYLLLDN